MRPPVTGGGLAGRTIPKGDSFVVDRQALARTISANTPGLSVYGAEQLVAQVFGSIRAELRRHGDVRIPGVGRLKTKLRAARRGRNPRTGEPLDIPAKKAIGFKASAQLLSEIFDDG